MDNTKACLGIGGGNGEPPITACLEDNPYRKPYTINKAIQGELYDITIISNSREFHGSVLDIIKEAKKTVADCLFLENFWRIVLAELLDNIYFHGDKTKHADFSLRKTDDSYIVEVSNFCDKKSFQKLSQIENIISQGDDVMTQHHKDQLLNGSFSNKGGGGVGMFSIVRSIKSHCPEKKDMTIFSVEKVGEQENSLENPIQTKITVKIPFPTKTRRNKNTPDAHHNC